MTDTGYVYWEKAKNEQNPPAVMHIWMQLCTYYLKHQRFKISLLRKYNIICFLGCMYSAKEEEWGGGRETESSLALPCKKFYTA